MNGNETACKYEIGMTLRAGPSMTVARSFELRWRSWAGELEQREGLEDWSEVIGSVESQWISQVGGFESELAR